MQKEMLTEANRKGLHETGLEAGLACDTPREARHRLHARTYGRIRNWTPKQYLRHEGRDVFISAYLEGLGAMQDLPRAREILKRIQQGEVLF